jgi:hypothetical protein
VAGADARLGAGRGEQGGAFGQALRQRGEAHSRTMR